MNNTKLPKFDMVGQDGNVFALMGAWSTASRRAGWTKEQISAVIDNCMSADYNHLLCVLNENSDSDTELDYDEDYYDDVDSCDDEDED